VRGCALCLTATVTMYLVLPLGAPLPALEVNSIVETVAATTRDFLRPLIIRESSVDELCRVIAALSEDVRSQMLGKVAPCYSRSE
jgi:hypothetical protein